MVGILLRSISTLGVVKSLLLDICMFFDTIIYKVADYALKAFFNMALLSADATKLSSTIGHIMYRLMVLAGVFALFRLAIMLINYLIDPSKSSNISKNGTSFVKGILLAIILLFTSRFIFEQLGRFQSLVITQNVIPKMIYGTESYEGESSNISKESKKFVNNVWLLFFTEKDGETCDEANASSWCTARYEVSQGFKGISNLSSYYDYFDYTPGVSGIMGIVLIYYFVIFAIELGVRIFKLIVLQIISPIPIIMSIDPSQSERLSKFGKTYIGIYLQVFLRIAALYLAFVVLGLITDSSLGMDSINGSTNFLVKALLYLGVFQAAKELPNLIEKAIGVKISGSTGKSSFGSVLGGIVGGTAGLVGGAVAGGVSGGFGGALLGAGSGLKAGVKVKDFKSAVTAAEGIGKAYHKGANVRGAGGLIPFVGGGVENFFGVKSKDKATLDAFEGKMKDEDKSISKFNKNISDINANISTQNKSMELRNKADSLRNNLQNVMDTSFRNSNPMYKSFDEYKKNDWEYTRLNKQISDNIKNKVYDKDSLQYKNDMQKLYARESQLNKNYENAKDTYFESMFTNNKGVNPEFDKALGDYNAFVSDHYMDDRVINSYKSGDESFVKAVEVNDTDKERIQSMINNYQTDIDKEQEKIANSQANKEKIEKDMNDYKKNDPGYIRRNERKQEPKAKAHKNVKGLNDEE